MTTAKPDVGVVLGYLALDRVDRDIFLGHNPDRGGNLGRVFGGHVAAQALRAATLTVETDHEPHSLHGYFMRPGEQGTPIAYLVDRIRDGRSFTTRRVRAVQGGEAIFSLEASFHRPEPGGEYRPPMPVDVPLPDAPDDAFLDVPRSRFAARAPFEVKEIEPPPRDERGLFVSTRRSWVRTRGPMPDDPALHACVLTYMSDMGVVSAARHALELDRERLFGASLDHAVWFHRPFRTDAWLLFDLRPVSNAGARGLAQGAVYSVDGVLVASLAQEALLREVER